MEKKQESRCIVTLLLLLLLAGVSSCQDSEIILQKPDEYTRTYEATEKIILKALAQVLKDKGFGKGTIDLDKNRLESEYIFQNKWRIKVIGTTKKINPRESELTLSVITEKQIKEGWQLRRLLEKEQYDKFFDAIELQIYYEIFKG